MSDTKQVVWRLAILRQDRDAERLSLGLILADATCVKFSRALMEWLKHRDTSRDKPPLCLTCDHAFASKPPTTFLMTYSEDPAAACVMLSGICRRCAKESDEKLAGRATPLLCKAVGDGQAFHAHPDDASPSTH